MPVVPCQGYCGGHYPRRDLSQVGPDGERFCPDCRAKTQGKHETMDFMERLTGMTTDERRHLVTSLLNDAQGRIMFGPIEAWKANDHIYTQKPNGEVNAFKTDDPEWLLQVFEDKARFSAGRSA